MAVNAPPSGLYTPPKPREIGVPSTQTDFEKLREQQLEELNQSFARASYNADWEKIRAKYEGRKDLTASEYHQYAAAKKQYELSSASLGPQREQAIAQVNKFYDAQRAASESATALSALMDESGQVKDIMTLANNPDVTRFDESLRIMRAMLSEQNVTDPAQQAQINEQLAAIDEQLDGLTEMRKAVAAQTEWNNQTIFRRGWEGTIASMKEMVAPKINMAKIPLILPGGLVLGGFMGGLSAAFPKQMAYWQRNVDDRWGAYIYQSSIKPYQEAWHALGEGDMRNVAWNIWGAATLGKVRLDYLKGGEYAEEYKARTPELAQVAISFTNPVYFVGGWALGASLKVAGRSAAMTRALVPAAEEMQFGYRGMAAAQTLKYPEAAKAIWVSRLPQEAAIAKWLNLGAKYPWIGKNLPAIAEYMRPVLTKQMFGTEVVPALLTPAEVSSRIMLTAGNVAYAGLKGEIALRMLPVRGALGLNLKASMVAQERLQLVRLNQKMATKGLHITTKGGDWLITGKGVNVPVRDVIEAANYYVTGSAVPGTRESFMARVYLDELRPTNATEGTIMSNAQFAGVVGNIVEVGGRAVYSIEDQLSRLAYGTSNEPLNVANAGDLTVVTEAQVRRGIRPSNVSPEVWEAAQKAFANEKPPIIWDSTHRLPPEGAETFMWKDDGMKPVVNFVTRVPGGTKLIGTINGRALAQSNAQRGFMFKLAVEARGASDLNISRANIMQYGWAESGPFKCTIKQTADGIRNPYVNKSSIKTNANWDRIPAEYRSLHLSDVCSWNPDHRLCPFDFTPDQAAYIRALHKEVDLFYDLGVKGTLDAPKQWEAANPMVRGAFRYIPRAMQRDADNFSFLGWTEQRTYETAHASAEHGHGVGAPIRSFETYGQTVWTKIANKRMADIVKLEGKSETQVLADAGFPVERGKVLFDQESHLKEVKDLVHEMRTRGSHPHPATVAAVLRRYPRIAAAFERAVAMPEGDVLTTLRAIDDKVWRQIETTGMQGVSATEQTVWLGTEALARSRYAGEKPSIGTLMESSRDVQFDRLFPQFAGRRLEDVNLAKGFNIRLRAAQVRFELVNPDITLADLTEGLARVNVAKDAQQAFIAAYYERASGWTLRYAKQTKVELRAIKRASEAAKADAMKLARKESKARWQAMKDLEDTMKGEEAAIAEERKAYDALFKDSFDQIRQQEGLLKVPNVPALKDLWFSREDADLIIAQTRAADPKGNVVMDFLTSGSTAMRVLQAAMDFSAPLTYGLPLAVINPAGFGRAVKDSFLTFLDPRVHMRWTTQNRAALEEFVSRYGGFVGGSEFYSMESQWGKYFRFPKEGTAMAKAIGKTSKAVEEIRELGMAGKIPGTDRRLVGWEQAEKSFSAFGDVARLELWEALKPLAQNEADLYDLAQMCNKMTGVQDTKALGIAAWQRQLESGFIFFAPRYRRAGWALLTDFFRGGITGKVARMAISRLMVGGVMMYVGTCWALGQEPILDPTKSNFLTVRIGNRYYGLNSGFISQARFIADLAVTGATKPSDFISGNRRHNPVIKYFYKGAAPITGASLEAINRTTFLGYPMENMWDYCTFIASKVTPMWTSDMWTEGNTLATGDVLGGITGAGASFLGMRTFEVPLWVRAKDLRNQLAGTAANLDAHQKSLLDQGKLTWEDLNYAQQRDILAANPDLVALTDAAAADTVARGDTYTKIKARWQDLRDQIKKEADDQEAAAVSEFRKNKALRDRLLVGDKTLTTEEVYLAQHAGQIFREKVDQIGKTRSAKQEFLRNSPEYADVYAAIAEWSESKNADLTQPAFDQAMDDYFTIMYGDTWADHNLAYDLPTTDQYGNPLYDNIEARKIMWRQYWGKDMAEQVIAELHRGEDPAVTELRNAREVLAPYWDLYKNVSASGIYPLDSAEQASRVMAEMKAINPTAAAYYRQLQMIQAYDPAYFQRISSDVSVRALLGWANSLRTPTVQSVLATEREKFRRENPTAEAYGEMFYDWATLAPETETGAIQQPMSGWRYE